MQTNHRGTTMDRGSAFRNLYRHTDNRCHSIDEMIACEHEKTSPQADLWRRDSAGTNRRRVILEAVRLEFQIDRREPANFRAHACPLRVGAPRRPARLAWRTAGRSCRHGWRAQTPPRQFDESRGGVLVPGRAAVFLADCAQV